MTHTLVVFTGIHISRNWGERQRDRETERQRERDREERREKLAQE